MVKTMQPLAAFDSMPDCVPEVEHATQSRFLFIVLNDKFLDGKRAFNNGGDVFLRILVLDERK